MDPDTVCERVRKVRDTDTHLVKRFSCQIRARRQIKEIILAIAPLLYNLVEEENHALFCKLGMYSAFTVFQMISDRRVQIE